MGRRKVRNLRNRVRRKWNELKEKWSDRKKKSAEEKMARAERELPPKLTRLLSRGVSRLRLWATLQVWRLAYGLKRLGVVKRSEGAGYVEGAASPGVSFAELVGPTDAMIVKILGEESRLAMESVQATSGPWRLHSAVARGAGTRAKPIVVHDPLAAAAFLREHVRTMGKDDELHFRFPGKGVASLKPGRYAKRDEPIAPGHLVVQGFPWPGAYGDIARGVQKTTPPTLEAPLELLDIVEMSRSDSAIAMVAARKRIVESGRGATLADLYTQSPYVSGEAMTKRNPTGLTEGAAYAPAQVGAGEAQRGVEAAMADEPLAGKGTPGSRYFQETRQIGMARELVRIRVRAEQPTFATQEEVDADIRARFRKTLQELLALSFPVTKSRKGKAA